MKNIIATLIAGLFATAAFAQTPAPAAPASTTATPAVAKADAKTSVKESKVEGKADVKEAKHEKKVAHHQPMTHKDTTVAAATPAPTTVK